MSDHQKQFDRIRKALLEFEDFLDRDTDHALKYYTDAEYAHRIYRQTQHINDTLLLAVVSPQPKPPSTRIRDIARRATVMWKVHRGEPVTLCRLNPRHPADTLAAPRRYRNLASAKNMSVSTTKELPPQSPGTDREATPPQSGEGSASRF